MGLQGDELRPLPVLTLKDGVQIPGLVGAIWKQDGLCVLGAHLAGEIYHLEEKRPPYTGSGIYKCGVQSKVQAEDTYLGVVSVAMFF